MEIISDSLRQRIKKEAAAFFKTTPEVELNKFNQLVLRKKNINYADYVEKNAKLKNFFDLFDDVFYLRKKKEGDIEAWYCSSIDSDPAKIGNLFVKIIEENGGSYLMCDIPERLKVDLGIDHKKYLAGKKQRSWLENDYINLLKVSEDGNYISLVNPAVDIAPVLEVDQSEIVQMHELSFMDFWSTNAKKLQNYTQLVKEPNEWRSIVALSFAKALLGINKLYKYTVDGVSKIVFDIGMKTLGDNFLFCVIGENPRYKQGMQPLKIEGFCCPFEDESDLAAEIKENVPEITKSIYSVNSKYEELQYVLEQLAVVREALASMQIEDAVKNGTAFDSKTFGLLKQYYAKWEIAKEIIDFLNWDSENNEQISIDAIFERLKFSNKKSDSFNKARDIVSDVLSRICQYCNDYNLNATITVINKDIELVKSMGIDNLAELNAVLQRYLELSELTQEKETTDEIILKMESIEAYFKGLGTRVQTKLFMGQAEDALLSGNVEALKEAADLLSVMDIVSEVEGNEEYEINADILLEKAIKDSEASDSCIEILEIISHFPESRFEKSVALGDYSQAINLLNQENIELPDCVTKEEIEKRINDEKNLSGVQGLALSDCGKRLYNVIGNYNRTAEKYFIAGLFADSQKCGKELLELYYSEGVLDKFFDVWQKYCRDMFLSLDKFKFLLGYFAACDESEIETYLSDCPYYYYMDEYAKLIIEVLEESGFVGVVEKAKKCLNYISNLPPVNSFEKMIIDFADKSKYITSVIKDYVLSNEEDLLEEGYSQDELTAINNIIKSLEINEASVSAAELLYNLQKNKNGTVERLAWTELSRGYDEEACVLLLHIYKDSERYEELISLYESYEAYVQDNRIAREIYLYALILTKNEKIKSFICENFQDFVRISAEGSPYRSSMMSVFDEIIDGNDEQLAAFVNEILRVCNMLSEPIIKNIVLLTNDLRRVDAESLSDFGLEQKQIDSFLSVYKTDNYSHERSVIETASRIFSFIGVCRNVAKELLDFAETQGYKNLKLKWNISYASGDLDEQLEIIQQNPEFINGREKEYCSLLFQKGMYKEFLEETEKIGYEAEDYEYKSFIARCKRKLDIDEALNALISKQASMPASLMADISSCLAECGYISAYEAFIIQKIENILSDCQVEEIKQIVSAGGKADEDVLKNLQKTAKKENCEPLVIFLYENFGIGRFKSASKDYLNKMLEQCFDDSCSAEEKNNIYRQLQAIYSSNNEYIGKIILGEINNILVCDSDVKIKQKEVSDIIAKTEMTKDWLKAFTDISAKNVILFSETICKSVLQAGLEMQLHDECIDYLDSFSGIENIYDSEILYMICFIYKAAMDKGALKVGQRDTLEDVCLKLIGTRHFGVAGYCLYKIYLEKGECDIAKFVLVLLNGNQEKLSQDISEEIGDEYKKTFDKPVDITDLFIEMAERVGIEEFDEYCRKCGKFISDKNTLLQRCSEIINDESGVALSKNDTNTLVKLLYTQPDNSEYLKNCLKIPLDANPVAHSKLLYKVALKENKLSLWKTCIEKAEECALSELMSEALLNCAKRIALPFGLRDLREYLLARAENNPLYFASMDEQHLIDMMAALCVRTLEDGMGTMHHNAIRELSTIAIATDSKNVFDTMHNYLYEYLYGANSNVGFATVCRLILGKNFEDALEMLKALAKTSNLKYPKLVAKLSEMNVEELIEWSSLSINKELLNMILPDGNLPKIEKINEFILDYSCNSKAEEAAELICEIIENNSEDYGCYMALFILCKQLPDRLDLLHKALCGLIENNPIGSSKSYYIRSRKDYAIFLARINAIIIKKNLISTIGRNISPKDFYIKHESNSENVNDILILESIAKAQSDAEKALTNQSEESREIISSIIWASVTGNWYNLILKCWSKQIPLKDYLADYYDALNSNDGLSRSVLKAVYSLDDSERGEFMSWAEKQFASSCKDQMDIASYLYNGKYFEKLSKGVLELSIFDLPFEEYSAFTQIYTNSVMQFVSKAPEEVDNCAVMVGALARENRTMGEFWKTAMLALEASNDVVAFGMFSALYTLKKKYGLEHKTEKDIRKMPELYQSLMRVTGAFAGDEKIIEKISSQNFKTHSCINMVFALVYTSRANEVDRLKQYFCESNQLLVDALLLAFNTEADDEDKFLKVTEIEDEITRGFLCYILLKRNYKEAKYWFLKSNEAVLKIQQMYNVITNNNPGKFSLTESPYPKKYLLIEPQNINPNIYTQLEVTPSMVFNGFAQVEEAPEYIDDGTILSFVADLKPADESGVSIEALWAEHEGKNSFGLSRYKDRKEIAERIYRLALKEELPRTELNDYALRYGVDYYYCCIGDKNYRKATDIIIEMVNVYESNRDSEGSIALKRVVGSSALYEILYHGYSNIYDMVENYAKNRQAFIRMRNMLPNSMSEEIGDVNSIYKTLEFIENSMSNISQDMLPAIRDVLFQALRRLGSNDVTGWGNIKALVHRMIQEEINKIDQRPRLVLEILSKESNLPYGSIFGQIKNIGNAIAENISIQVRFWDDTLSDVYLLPRLDKEETAPFEIPYSGPDGIKEILYDVIVTFIHGGEEISHIENGNVLTIESGEFKNYDSGIYLTGQPISDFVALEDGTIHSDNFFGRDEELRSINNIFNAKSFVNYKNVIIKGIRRAGKTSVLNYLKTYIRENCDDAIAIYVNCLGFGKDPTPMYTALVKPAIAESKLKNYANSMEEWDKFEAKWKLQEGADDFNPDDLQYFYRELKMLNGGKGVMLIIDEFDVLLEAVEESKGVDASLLPALRGLLNNADCQSAIHLVICGSNKMIRYMDGGTFNQLFQQFGSNNIEIGMLLFTEMEQMIKKPLEARYPYVEFTQQALDWLWKYTNGLVWYSKLIATDALELARKDRRTTVYPSDVVHAATKVVGNDDFFKSLVTSCTAEELKVLDVVQGVTARATEYVSVSKLLDILSGEFTQKDIEGIINILERMQFIEKNPYDGNSCRFAVQLYWYYFRKNPSNFDRVPEIPVEFKKS